MSRMSRHALKQLLARQKEPESRPILMGIVNITPNSFSDGNLYLDPSAAIAHGRELLSDGAEILDLGAEASSFFRPGVEAVSDEEQLRRLLPVVGALAGEALLSIDTRSARVARECIAHGAALINDISAGEFDPEMLPTAAEAGVPIALMHIMPGYPAMPAQDDPDIVAKVRDALLARASAAEKAGVKKENILLDPGVGFGKTMNDNWKLVDHIGVLAATGYPVLLGVSRKRFLCPAGGAPTTEEKDRATAQITWKAWQAGVPVHRVHNARAVREWKIV